MIVRLARAYGVDRAAAAAVGVLVVLAFLGQHVIGVTRQPLPLTWPLSVLLVLATQLPLRDVLGPVERVALRSPLARGVRAAICLVLVAVGSAFGVAGHGDPELRVFTLTLAALGFVAARILEDSWAWILGVGMGWVGLQFVTPLGAGLASALGGVPLPVAAVTLLVSASVYVAAGGRSRAAR